MTQATSRNTTVADAILALINSSPRTPTREQIISAIANFRPEADNDNTPWRPSPEAMQILDLLPPWAAAINVESDYPAPGKPGFDEQEWRAIEQATSDCNNEVEERAADILRRPFYPPTPDWEVDKQHLVDLALIANIWNEGELVLKCGQWHLGPSPVPPTDVAVHLLVHHVLRMAGLKPKECSLDGAWPRKVREPTRQMTA